MTLLEVVAVLLVLGVLTLTVVSRMTTGTMDLTATIDGISSRIRLVQAIAMNSSPGIQGIRFETSGQTYYMFHCDDPDNCVLYCIAPINCTITAISRPLPGTVDDEKENPNDPQNYKLKVSAGQKVSVLNDNNVAFDSFGTPYRIINNRAVALTNPLDLSFSDMAGNTGTIQVTPKTGFIP